MTSTLTALAAREHVEDLHRAQRNAGGRLRSHRQATNAATDGGSSDTVVLKMAGAEDGQSVRTLAELDEAAAPTGEVLLAFIDGEAVAALSLDDGQVVSNPFVATSGAIALLRLRARHLAGPARRRGPWLRPRFA
jgi:hypothetical protein